MRIHKGFQKDVYDALLEHGPTTCLEISLILGVTKDSVNGQMRRLHNKGRAKVVSSNPHTGNVWVAL